MGVLAEAEYRGTRVRLRRNDLLLLFSDGLVETMNEQQELFRTDGVIEAVGDHVAEERIEDVMSRVWNACDRHGGGTVQDDRTLLVLRMQGTGRPAGPHRRRSRSSRPREALVENGREINSR